MTHSHITTIIPNYNKCSRNSTQFSWANKILKMSKDKMTKWKIRWELIEDKGGIKIKMIMIIFQLYMKGKIIQTTATITIMQVNVKIKIKVKVRVRVNIWS